MADEKLIRYSHDLLGGKVPFEPVTFGAAAFFQEWEVPPGHRKIRVDIMGGKGYGGEPGSSAPSGGYGGRVTCVLEVKPRQKLYIWAGRVPTSLTEVYDNSAHINTSKSNSKDTILVIAGGGGSVGAGNTVTPGGAGGGTTGAAGNNAGCSGGGKGGTQTAGGAGGVYIPWTSQQVTAGSAGTFLKGGAPGNNRGIGGAGGAGWYGGGGGAGGFTKSAGTYGGGGGGGSSYTHPTLCSEVTHYQGYRNYSGYVTISMY